MDKFDACAVNAQRLKEAFLHDVDADTQAFDAMMAAMRFQNRLLNSESPSSRYPRRRVVKPSRHRWEYWSVVWKRWTV